MKFWKRLDNPFLLVVEGFVAGGIIFWATSPESPDRAQDSAAISTGAPVVGAQER